MKTYSKPTIFFTNFIAVIIGFVAFLVADTLLSYFCSFLANTEILYFLVNAPLEQPIYYLATINIGSVAAAFITSMLIAKSNSNIKPAPIIISIILIIMAIYIGLYILTGQDINFEYSIWNCVIILGISIFNIFVYLVKPLKQRHEEKKRDKFREEFLKQIEQDDYNE